MLVWCMVKVGWCPYDGHLAGLGLPPGVCHAAVGQQTEHGEEADTGVLAPSNTVTRSRVGQNYA